MKEIYKGPKTKPAHMPIFFDEVMVSLQYPSRFPYCKVERGQPGGMFRGVKFSWFEKDNEIVRYELLDGELTISVDGRSEGLRDKILECVDTYVVKELVK